MAITVNPARAGMIPKAFTAGPSAASKPRASGDDPGPQGQGDHEDQ